ncbi:MAG: aspartyl protease family protein [Bacteroidetes bacterium]|nr:aspartyl protease family protein [Bacteroidota bacterium]
MRIKIPIEIIELESDNYHIMVSSVFADGISVNWIIDTGASKTVFDKTLVEYYSVSEGESDEIHTAGIGEQPMNVILAELNSMSFGKLKIGTQKVALLDLSHINELYSKVSDIKISGLLGGDFLMKHRAVIDYQKKLLILKKS